MTTSKNYFPTGIVTGAAFCDRVMERDLLEKRFEQNAHVVIMSPRRYGKSSLIAQFTVERDVPVASVDLLPATSNKYVRNAILDSVSELLSSILPRVKKKKEQLLSIFSNMNPVIELSAFGQKIKLTPYEKEPEETILKLLLNLDKVAAELNKKIIFVMDEFQQIASLEQSHSIEASIRHSVERSQNVFYIFSGSNRTLLEKMFKNKNRPLYHLCDEFKLARISFEDYFEFIKTAKNNSWKKGISENSIKEILKITECHSYYVNRLCRLLWDLKTPPSIEKVNEVWMKFVNSQLIDWVAESIGNLTRNQRTILAAIAKEPEKEISSKNFLTKVEISGSSLHRTISTLVREDYLFIDNDGYYRVLNPVVRSYLSNNKYFEF